MGTLLFGIGIGVVTTVGTAVAVASGCADRVVAAFAADDAADEAQEGGSPLA